MLHLLDGEDRVALIGTRRAVEAARLPADVREAFREWVLMGLCRRGRCKLSDYFFDVLRAEGFDDIDDEVRMYATFLASEFARYLCTDGRAYASRFLPARPVKPAPKVQKRGPRVPSPVGPALPPALVATLRAAGEQLSEYEDISSGVWDLKQLSTAVDEVLAAHAGEGEDSLVPMLGCAFPPGAVIVDGVDWGDPQERFFGAVAVALSDPSYLEQVALGNMAKLLLKGDRRRPPPLPDIGRPARDLGSAVVPTREVRFAGRGPDAPGVGVGSGGSVCGYRALVANRYHPVADSIFGEDGCTLDAVINWVAQDPSRAYRGGLAMFADFKAASGGPYPARFYLKRMDGSALTLAILTSSWRGRAAPLANHFPPGVG